MKRKRLTGLIAALIISASLATTAHAAVLDVYVRGVALDRSGCELTESVTCVQLREFCRQMTDGEAVVGWDGGTQTATVQWRGTTVSASVGDRYITANGRYFYCGVPCHIKNGSLMVPIRAIAGAFGADVEWNGEIMRASVRDAPRVIVSGDDYYDGWELFWLSRIISAESRGEPLLGKIAVGTVVYDRVASPKYPDTVYGVIFDMKNGVQFTPAYSGSVYEPPTEESVIAAKLCMEGARVCDGAMYFCTTNIMKTSWAGRNRPYMATIGNHAFFA